MQDKLLILVFFGRFSIVNPRPFDADRHVVRLSLKLSGQLTVELF